MSQKDNSDEQICPASALSQSTGQLECQPAYPLH